MNKKFIVRADVPKEPALIIKNQLLLSPGKWKGQNITREAILNGLNNTPWDDGKSTSIIYGHRTNSSTTYFGDPSPDMWVGYHTKPKYLTLSDGVSVEGMYADYYIYDTELASKLAYGGVRAGVSEGMEFDYHTGQINKFINSSVVNDPACKNAFLNLSEGEEFGMELTEPRFLNLSEIEIVKGGQYKTKDGEEVIVNEITEDQGKITIETEEGTKQMDLEAFKAIIDKRIYPKKENLNLAKEETINTAERRLNGKDMDNNMEDKMKAFDEKVSKVESQLEEISKKLSEKKEDTPKNEAPKETPKKEEPEEEKPKETVDEPKKTSENKEAVVIEKKEEPKPEPNRDSEVVNAINNMSNKFVEEVKKVASPQSVAPTNPNAQKSTVDDEKITDQLVEQYSKLHPENKSNE